MAQLIVRIPISQITPPEGYFIATNGRWGARGTIFDPFSMEYAISTSSPIVGDDQVWMRGGLYTPLTAGTTSLPYLDGSANVAGKGVYTFKIKGTDGHMITLRNYPGERVKINGSFHMNGLDSGYIRMWGIECANIPTTRVYTVESDVESGAIYVTSPGCQFINCHFHEHYCNFFYADTAGGTNLFHGCIMGNVGAYINSIVVGYCMYTHNGGQSPYIIEKSAFYGSVHDFNINPHTTGAHISSYRIRDNILFGGGLQLGSGNALNRDNRIDRNYFYNPDGTPGSSLHPYGLQVTSYDNVTDPLGEEVEVEYNYIVSGGPTTTRVPGRLWARNVRCRYNTFIDRSATSVLGVLLHLVPTGAITEVVWDYNTYWTNYGSPFESNQTGSYVRYTLANWRTLTGYDMNSSIAGTIPTTNVVKITANDYEVGRGQIGIYNWENLGSVNVDLSSLNITHMAACRLYNILNYPTEYLDFQYNADNPILSIPMNVWTQGQPVGYDIPLTWHANPMPAFGMFEVRMR